MRVAFLVDLFPALTETFILSQITGLIDKGLDVSIHATARERSRRWHADVAKYDLISRTIYSDGFPTHKAGRLAQLAWQLLRRPGPVRRAQIRAMKSRHESFLLPYLVPDWAGRDYDIIHAHFGPLGLRAVALRDACKLRARVTVTLHGYDMSSYLRDRGPGVYDDLFKRADMLLPISSRWRDKLIAMGCPEDKVQVHRMGIDCTAFAFTARQKAHAEPLKLLSVARLVEKKGIAYAIEAVRKLKENGLNVRYSIVGDGPLRPNLERLTAEFGLSDRISFLGPMDQESVRQQFYASHVFVCPSVTASNGDQEGIPVVLMEAMASGMPVIATRHSGIPELVQDGISGKLVEENDVEGLARAAGWLAEKEPHWAAMGAAGRKKVEEEFNSSRLTQDLISIYAGLTSEARP